MGERGGIGFAGPAAGSNGQRQWIAGQAFQSALDFRGTVGVMHRQPCGVDRLSMENSPRVAVDDLIRIGSGARSH